MDENKIKALITPELLVWAREKAGLTIADVVEKIEVVPKIITSWEQGLAKPTLPEARKLAEIYKVHFAMFFLSEPPKEKEKITLRKIIRGMERISGYTSLGRLILKDLKRLEERIEKIIPPSTLKNNCIAAITRKAIAGMLQDILQDILGEK